MEPPMLHPVRQRCNWQLTGFVFDMGDVLYDATIWRRWLINLLARMGQAAHYQQFYRVWDHEYLNDVHCGRREYHEAFQAFLLSQGLSRGLIDEIEAASQARRRALETSLRPLPGVRSTITRLHALGFSLAVLSDSESPADVLRQRLARLGMPDQFHSVLSSVELGKTKPDAACYHAALAELRMPAERVAFVGHDAEELDGAAAVGMPTIAFNYEAGTRANRFVERFDELLGLTSQRFLYAVAG